MKSALSLTTFLTSATCIVALACGHEAAAPAASTVPAASAIPAAPNDLAATSAPVAAVALTAAEVPGGCIEVDAELGGKRTTLEGRIFVDARYEHPARGKTHPFILRLDVPRCARGIDDAQVTEIHLASSEGVALRPLVGKHVRVSGDPFVAHTAWHARPIVLMTIAARAL